MYSKPIKLNKTQVLFLPASLVLYLLYVWLLTDLKKLKEKKKSPVT